MKHLKQYLAVALAALLPVTALAGNDHNLETVKTQGLGRVLISGSFAPNGSSALSSGSVNGTGYTVARSTTGVFTLTFADAYPALLSATATAQNSAQAGTRVEFGPYDATAKTLKIYTYQGSTGVIPIDLINCRVLATNDVQNTAAIGGMLTKDSTPILQTVNAGTDNQLEVRWAATVVNKVACKAVVPPDLDVTAAVVINAYAKMSGATNTPTLTYEAFVGYGGTDLGGASGALSSTAAVVTKSIAANAVFTVGKPITVTIVPGTHGTDAVSLSSLYLTYTKSLGGTDITANANNRINFNLVFKNTSVGGSGTGAH